MPTPRLSASRWAKAIRDGDRAALARAITLIESRKATDVKPAQALLAALLPHTGGAYRVGISGVPGAGKSTFIEALGLRLLEQGRRVAVLAVDPSSALSGGSILGDKTRMTRLSADPRAFIRPSPSALTLGGVGRRTREALLLCEAAGYDVVLIETVGVGQSETLVAGMVDFFLALMLPGGGDELQGIKKGILEIADMVVVNKADGENLAGAQAAQGEYAAALRYLPPRDAAWTPAVMTCSARTGEGLEAVWRKVEEHRSALDAAGGLALKRRAQHRQWMWDQVHEQVLDAFDAHPAVRARIPEIEKAVAEGRLTATEAARELLKAFGIKA